MFVIHFIGPERQIVLTKLVNHLPALDEQIKVKGRKGKVIKVEEMKENNYYVYIQFESLVKKKEVALDKKRKKR